MAVTMRKVKGGAALPYGQRLDGADLYRFALRVGLHLLAARRLKRALRYLVQPVHYWRGVEYRLVWNEAGFRPDDRVLDVGSPKLLSLYLAEKIGAEVFATDIDSYFLDEYALLRSARRLSDQLLRLQVEDGRRLGFADASFTKAYAVSVLEHIPDLGDTECMKEIARVLRPGGRCLLTVPYGPVFKEKYKEADFYWAASSNSTPDGRVFFQRRYSEPELFARLIEPSGLTLDRLEYIGERVLVRSAREFGDFLVPPTGPAHPILSRLVHTGPARSPHELAKPLCAFLALTKPAA
jgi:SAM-dependent methyltransferase